MIFSFQDPWLNHIFKLPFAREGNIYTDFGDSDMSILDGDLILPITMSNLDTHSQMWSSESCPG